MNNRQLTQWFRNHPVNLKTVVGHTRLGRNDPCVCGSMDGDKPKKFKHCCWWKYATLKVGQPTPELDRAVKKEQKYLIKQLEKKNV